MNMKITSLDDIKSISAKSWKGRPDMQKLMEKYLIEGARKRGELIEMKSKKKGGQKMNELEKILKLVKSAKTEMEKMKEYYNEKLEEVRLYGEIYDLNDFYNLIYTDLVKIEKECE